MLGVYALMLFSHAAAPSLTDYANWTYQGVLLARHIQGFPDATHLLKPYPVPNSAATLAIGTLNLFLPWVTAAKVWLCIQMFISFLALRHFTRTVQADGAVWLIVPQATLLGVNWWYGFVNFQLGCAWLMLFASLLLRFPEQAIPRQWLLGLLLVIVFFTHMIPLAVCFLLLALYAGQTKRWRVMWQVLPSGLLCVWYLLGRYLIAHDADGQAGMVSAARIYSWPFWLYKANSLAKSFGFVNPEGSTLILLVGRLGFVVLFAINMVLVILLVCSMTKACLSSFSRGSKERFLWLGVVALLPCYLLAPGAALGISDPGSRLLQTGLAVALVLCCGYRGWPLQAAKYCSLTLSFMAVVLFSRFAFGSPRVLNNPPALPGQMAVFAHVPNHDQDVFYEALDGGQYDLRVFPTGMFLNRR